MVIPWSYRLHRFTTLNSVESYVEFSCFQTSDLVVDCDADTTTDTNPYTPPRQHRPHNKSSGRIFYFISAKHEMHIQHINTYISK